MNRMNIFLFDSFFLEILFYSLEIVHGMILIVLDSHLELKTDLIKIRPLTTHCHSAHVNPCFSFRNTAHSYYDPHSARQDFFFSPFHAFKSNYRRNTSSTLFTFHGFAKHSYEITPYRVELSTKDCLIKMLQNQF